MTRSLGVRHSEMHRGALPELSHYSGCLIAECPHGTTLRDQRAVGASPDRNIISPSTGEPLRKRFACAARNLKPDTSLAKHYTRSVHMEESSQNLHQFHVRLAHLFIGRLPTYEVNKLCKVGLSGSLQAHWANPPGMLPGSGKLGTSCAGQLL